MKECGYCNNWDGAICLNILSNNYGAWELKTDCEDWSNDENEC